MLVALRGSGISLGGSRCLLHRSCRPVLRGQQARTVSSGSGRHMEQAEQYAFGPHTIRASEVFATTPLSFAFVNLKPIVPGHVLISPRRVLRRFADLSPQEASDLWLLAQRVGTCLEAHHGAASLTLAIQDGPAAGQTVPHVHVHCLPRKPGDFERNDDVYDALDESAGHLPKLSDKLDLDKERVIRTPEEMVAEAAEYRGLFQAQ